MIDNAAISGLTWDLTIPKSLSSSQRWILSAMQSHGPELVTMLWRILGNEQDVCDVYQNTFLRLAHYEGGQKPDNIKSYVFRSASNTAISLLRQKAAEKRLLTGAAAKKQNPDTSRNDFNTGQLQESLRRAIAELPENLRSVVTLHDLGELSYDQTAKVLGISDATARVYRCKAIQLLAVWMNKEKEENL